MRTEQCPKCWSNAPQYSHGKTQKRNKRYRCSECKQTYILNKQNYFEEYKESMVQMYIRGISCRKLSRIFGAGQSTIYEWVYKYNEKSTQNEEDNIKLPETVEITEEMTRIIMYNIIKEYEEDQRRIKELRTEAIKLLGDTPTNIKRYVDIIQKLSILNPPDEDDKSEHFDILYETIKECGLNNKIANKYLN